MQKSNYDVYNKLTMKKYIEVIKVSLSRMSKEEKIFMFSMLALVYIISTLTATGLAIVL